MIINNSQLNLEISSLTHTDKTFPTNKHIITNETLLCWLMPGFSHFFWWTVGNALRPWVWLCCFKSNGWAAPLTFCCWNCVWRRQLSEMRTATNYYFWPTINHLVLYCNITLYYICYTLHLSWNWLLFLDCVSLNNALNHAFCSFAKERCNINKRHYYC